MGPVYLPSMDAMVIVIHPSFPTTSLLFGPFEYQVEVADVLWIWGTIGRQAECQGHHWFCEGYLGSGH